MLDWHCVRLVGDTSTTFWRMANSTPNAEFEKVSDGYAVIQDLSIRSAPGATESLKLLHPSL